MSKFVLSVCCFCISFLSLQAEDENVVRPDERGIFSLGVDNGVMKRMAPRDFHGTKSTGIFGQIDSAAIWKVDVPFPGRYIVELGWSVMYSGGELLIEVDNKKALKWKTAGTWGTKFVISRIDSKLMLPQGKVSLVLSMPNQRKSDGRIEMYSVRLIPISLEPTIKTLASASCLGMSLKDMELRLGKALPETKSMALVTQYDKGDAEVGVFRDLEPKCESYIWHTTFSERVKASFINDQCIAVWVLLPNSTFPQAMKYTSKLVGGVAVPTAGYDKSKAGFNVYVDVKGEKCKIQYDEEKMTVLIRNCTLAQKLADD